jgi:hypothetical protein
MEYYGPIVGMLCAMYEGVRSPDVEGQISAWVTFASFVASNISSGLSPLGCTFGTCPAGAGSVHARCSTGCRVPDRVWLHGVHPSH